MTLTPLGISHPWQAKELGYLSWDKVRFDFPRISAYDHKSNAYGGSYIPLVWKPAGGLVSAEFALVGNEPEWPGQTDMEAEAFVKRLPAGNIAIPGTRIDHPSGIEWLYRMSMHLQELPAAWHVHLHYAEDAPTWLWIWQEFKRGWYAEHGHGLPVIISETCGTEFMSASGLRLLMRTIADTVRNDPVLVSVFWYCTKQYFLERDDNGKRRMKPYWPHCWLYDEYGELTQAGRDWRALCSQAKAAGNDHSVYLPSVQGDMA